MTQRDADIFISGGGVAGLTAAAAFGTAGFEVVIADPAPPVTEASDPGADLRTTAFLQPARDFLARAGLWERLAPFATPLQIMRVADAAVTPPVITDFDAVEISDLPFGWNLPNWLLRREMVARLAELPNVDFRPGVGFRSILTRSTEARVKLSDGARVNVKLVIGADGRGSPVREATGIDVQTTRYGQRALTFAVTHPQPHENISTEIHRAGGPFTLVPLPDQDGRPCSAVVWMETGAEVARLKALSDDAFNAAATERSAQLYGPLELVTRRTDWPIISQMAERLTAQRVALVAEAAHVMPPIGAQGLNTSLKDLSALLDHAIPQRADPGQMVVLDGYSRARTTDIMLRIKGIDALNRTSMAGSPMLQGLRSAGIRALHRAGPVKRGLMNLGLGAG